MAVIIDTNVAVVANGKSEQASEDCEGTCISRLQEITSGKVKLVVDDQRRIIEEYRGNLSPTGQPGVGDAFLKWVEMNWTNETLCDRVIVSRIEGSDTEFEQFPADAALENFDSDDRIFVAVALTHPEKPPILQAVDRQWWDFRDALYQHDVTVEFICEDDIQQLREPNKGEAFGCLKWPIRKMHSVIDRDSSPKRDLDQGRIRSHSMQLESY